MQTQEATANYAAWEKLHAQNTADFYARVGIYKGLAGDALYTKLYDWQRKNPSPSIYGTPSHICQMCSGVDSHSVIGTDALVLKD